MYTDDYENRGYSLLRFIIKLIFIILLIILLIWLLVRFVVPKFSTNNKNISNENIEENISKNKTNKNKDKDKNKSNKNNKQNQTSSQIFNSNIETMKDAAISYYTNERLPQEIGESKTMTLKEMIEKKLVLDLKDKNNKSCNQEKSYVKITKVDDEYILKVNLKDSEKEDYILVHLGCYNYCNNDICQKENTKINIKDSKISDYVPIKGSIENGYYYPPTQTQTIEKNYYCKVVNGKYYGKKGNKVTKAEYEKQCKSTVITEEKHYCEIINGKYYDLSGSKVSKAEYEKQCKSTVITEENHYCEIVNGKYYGLYGSIISKEEYEKQCNNTVVIEEKHYCEIVNGKYYGKSGNKVTKTEYEKQCIKNYIYEYVRKTNAKLSEWSSWSNWSKTNCQTQEINCDDNNSSCLKKLQILKRKEKIGTYEKPYEKTRNVTVQTGSYTEKACSKYNYVEINKKTYTTSQSNYTSVNNINKNTRTTTGNWVYKGRSSYSNPPQDTNTTKYIFVGANYSNCNETCTTLPTFYYDIYNYTGTLTEVTSTTKEINTSSSATCASYTYKTIPIYSTITITDKDYRQEPLYGDVCYQSTKTRTVIANESNSYKWSTYNDLSLLNNGWSYTGNKKIK